MSLKRKFIVSLTKEEYEKLDPIKKIKTNKDDIYETWHDVSNWTEYQTKTILKMITSELEDFAPRFIKTYDVPSQFVEIIASDIERTDIVNYDPLLFRDKSEKTDSMVSYLHQIMAARQRDERNPESAVDTFVAFLFDTLGFGSRGLFFRAKPKQVMYYGNVEIVAIPDYGVRKFNEMDSFILLEESKPYYTKTGFDHQVMGQLFVFAWTKYETTEKDVHLFSVVVSGIYFIFYYAHFPSSYMEKIKNDEIPEESDTITIYKSKTYDFLNNKDRKECVVHLYSIRQQLLSEIIFKRLRK